MYLFFAAVRTFKSKFYFNYSIAALKTGINNFIIILSAGTVFKVFISIYIS